MKIAKRRACFSLQIAASSSRKLDFGGDASAGRSSLAAVLPSTPHTPIRVRIIAIAEITDETATSRAPENGSSAKPAAADVPIKPVTVMVHAMDAAALRRDGSVRLASSTKSEVPAAET